MLTACLCCPCLRGDRRGRQAPETGWNQEFSSRSTARPAVAAGGAFGPDCNAPTSGGSNATSRTSAQIGSIRLKTGAGSIRALVRLVALLPPLVGALQFGPMAPPAATAGLAVDRLLNS